MDEALHGLELRSKIDSDGTLTLSLEPVTLSAPGPDEVVVRVEAAPINPSDLHLLLGPIDLETMKPGGDAEHPTLSAKILEDRIGSMRSRMDQAMTVGNEGAGTVIAAGANGQALLGKRVGMIGGAMYATHRKITLNNCIPLPADASAADGASIFINPMTALAFVEIARKDGHKAIVHTAAASNLGQMLNRICQADGIALINIVRSEAQSAILRDLGARYVLDSNAEDFVSQLTDAIAETGATLAFDAIGGGKMGNTILHAMESAASRELTEYSRYGSFTWKQLYIYGALDTSPTVLDRGYGFSWGVNGFLLTPFVMQTGQATIARMRSRVVSELKTTFASHYSKVISLRDVLNPEHIRIFAKRATGEKYVIDPSL